MKTILAKPFWCEILRVLKIFGNNIEINYLCTVRLRVSASNVVVSSDTPHFFYVVKIQFLLKTICLESS